MRCATKNVVLRNRIMNFHFCSILTFKETEFNFLNERYSDTGIKIILFDKDNFNIDNMPILALNKEEYSFLIPETDNKLKWTLSGYETSEKEINKFIEKSIWNFSPQKVITYDALIEEQKVEILIKNLFDISKFIFVYFKHKACYIHSGQTTLIINLESIQIIGDDFKKVLSKTFSLYRTVFLSYNNSFKYLNFNKFDSVLFLDNIMWHHDQIHIVEQSFLAYFNDIAIYKHIPFAMEQMSINYINFTKEEIVHYSNFYQKNIITHWLSQQKICFDKSVIIQGVEFEKIKNNKFLQLEYSDKRTITGRINCIDKKFNSQLVPKLDPIRTKIISRYQGGKIVVFDYVSFEIKIALLLCNNEEFIEKYKNSDLHNESAKVIFQKEIISPKERALGKQINHTIMYGGGREKIVEELSSFFDKNEIESPLVRLREFLRPILIESNRLYKEYKTHGYIINSEKSIIRPNKAWATFNNYIQSTAADIVINKLFKIKDFIINKNISFMYQVYDSFIFDFSPECLHLVDELSVILSEYNNFNFLVEHKFGNTLAECS